MSALLRRETVLAGMPFRASVEISRNCNFSCVMCPQSWRPEYREYRPDYNMSPGLFRRVASELFAHLEEVNLQGFGETVVSPHWPEILRLCEPFADSLRFHIVTNLSRKDDAMWEDMVRMGFKIAFSCDGATKEVFEAVRRGGRFEVIEHNLDLIASRRRKGGRAGLDFNVTLQKLNYRQMPLFIDLAERAGADRVVFGPVQQHLPTSGRDLVSSWLRWNKRGSTGFSYLARYAAARLRVWREGGGLDLTIDGIAASELERLKEQTLGAARRAGIAVEFNGRGLAPDTPPPGAPAGASPLDQAVAMAGQVARNERCFKPYSFTVVNYRGDVGLCNHLITDDSWEQMGSLAESSFVDIWNSPRYQDARRRLAAGEPWNKTCRWCFKNRLRD